jgi:hypothetical protein
METRTGALYEVPEWQQGHGGRGGQTVRIFSSIGLLSSNLSLLTIRFVDRYIPGYVFFSDGAPEEGNCWKGQHLMLTIDANREVINIDTP